MVIARSSPNKDAYNVYYVNLKNRLLSRARQTTPLRLSAFGTDIAGKPEQLKGAVKPQSSSIRLSNLSISGSCMSQWPDWPWCRRYHRTNTPPNIPSFLHSLARDPARAQRPMRRIEDIHRFVCAHALRRYLCFDNEYKTIFKNNMLRNIPNI